ncbi:hypothetical protein [Bacillus sp. C30]
MTTTTNLYLELLKKAILFEIWQEHEQYLPTNQKSIRNTLDNHPI